MKTNNLVDVMGRPPPPVAAVAAESSTSSQPQPPLLDYHKAGDLFSGVRFIHECGQKLNASCLTVATASVLFHKFFKVAKKDNHDQFLIAAACLYVSGKLEEQDQQLKIRDLINVSHSALHRGSEPLGLDSQYYNLREVICQAELLVLRMVGFRTSFEHPHKFLLQHLSSLRAWMSEEVWRKYPIARTSWAILQDFYHDAKILSIVEPSSSSSSSSVISCSHLSLGCISLALQTYGIQPPYMADGGGDGKRSTAWFNAFSRDLTRDQLNAVTTILMEVYNSDERFVKPHYLPTQQQSQPK